MGPGPTLSKSLLLLLRHAKSHDRDSSWRGAAQVLAPIYSAQMRLVDVITVLLKAYQEALAEPRFELNRGHANVEDLILAPVRGLHSMQPFGGAALESTFNVEQFYNAIVGHLLGQFAIARVDWCTSALYPTPLRAIVPVPRSTAVDHSKIAAQYDAHR